MPNFFWRRVPPPRGMRPPLTIAWPPMSWFCSTTMTDAPWSRAMIAAQSPDAPAPAMTTSAERSHFVTRCAAASSWPATPTSAVAPTPSAPFVRNFRRLAPSLVEGFI